MSTDPALGWNPLSTTAPTRAGALLGRVDQLRALDELTSSVQDGLSGAVVIIGDPGIGKTRLLQYAASAAREAQVAGCVGVESEMHLDFAALHRLLLPYLGWLDHLPVPQREALGSVFGSSVGPTPDRFRVSLAALSLLAVVAEEQPLLCLIDDAQWLDRASLEVIAFVCRRLHADGIGVIVSLRAASDAVAIFDGLPVLRLFGLSAQDAREVLATAAPTRVDPQVADRIAEQTSGNPLALEEVAAGLTPEQLGGSAALPEALPVGVRLESLFLDQVRSLPAVTQEMLLLVSAAPSNDPSVLWRAAAALGLPAEATDPAVRHGVLGPGSHPAFRHPLIRSAVYAGAGPADRRRTHAALAAAMDMANDPDGRAWHLAAATVGHDEEVALGLDLAADRSRRRGGYAAQAAFSLRAADLSADRAARSARLLTSGQAQLRSGDLLAAQQRLAEAGPALVDPMMKAAATRAAAFIEFFFSRVGNVPPMLLEAAAKAAPHSPGTARDILFEAMVTAIIGHHEQRGWSVTEVARTVLASVAEDGTAGRTVAELNVPAQDREQTVPELLMVALATRHAIGFGPAAPILRVALTAMCSADLGTETFLSLAIPGCFAAAELWDDRGRREMLTRLIALERERDDLSSLHVSLRRLVRSDISEGNLLAAEQRHAEASAIGVAIGMPDNGPYMRGELWAWQGKQSALRELAASVFGNQNIPLGSAYGNLVRYAMALLEGSLRQYPEALAWALPIYRDDVAALSNAVLPEVIEAASRSGDLRTAEEALARLRHRATASGTPWAMGVLARCTAMMTDGQAADDCYLQALELLGRTLQRTELARTHLLYGEWLRRCRRRGDARRHLRIAHDLFATMGAAVFTERARAELLATGERARRRSVQTSQELTGQELLVARLAADGLTNTEIAGRLYITTSTVEYHLNKVFRKLDLTSRRQLAHRLDTSPAQTS